METTAQDQVGAGLTAGSHDRNGSGRNAHPVHLEPLATRGKECLVVTYVPASGTPEALASLGYTGTSWDQPQNLARGQLTTSERMPSVELPPGGPAQPLPPGPTLDVDAMEFTDPLTGRAMSGALLLDRRLYTDALAVIHQGR